MKKNKKTRITAMLLAAAAGLSSCTSKLERQQTVYGPPPEYDPSNDEVYDVYGPPVEELESEEQTESANEEMQTESGPEDKYRPEYDEVYDVYGPPPENQD